MRLRSRVFRHAQAEQVPRICEFLGEIVGIPFSDDGRVQLKAARQDPQLMGDQMDARGRIFWMASFVRIRSFSCWKISIGVTGQR